MDHVVRQTLEEFATTTRHRDYELEEQLELVARKFLATQAPIVDSFTLVYPHVSSDLERLAFRSESGGKPHDWSITKPIPLAVYQYLIPTDENSLAVRKMLRNCKGAYMDFRTHLEQLPINVNVEKYGPQLFFMHGARNKNLQQLLSEMYGNSLTPRDVESVYQHMRKYEISNQDAAHHVANDIGTMINNLQLDHLEQLGQLHTIGKETKDQHRRHPRFRAETNENEKEVSTLVFAPDHMEVESQKHIERLQSNPVLQTYKASASLPYHFASSKAVSQLMVSLLVPSTSDASRIAEPVMGKRQRDLPSMDTSKITTGDWQHLLDVATSKITANTGIERVTQVCDFYQTLGKCMPREELQQMTRADLIQHMITAFMPNYDQLWLTELTPPVRKAIEQFRAQHQQMDSEVVKQLV